MSKYKIINLLDKLFISIAIFLIIYAWTNFYLRNLWTTFFISLAFSFAIVYLLFFLLNLKNKKSSEEKNSRMEIEKNFLLFRLTPTQKKLNLLKKILSKNYETKIENGNLTFIKENKKHQIIVATHIEKLTENDLINLIGDCQNLNANELDIICNEKAFNFKKQIFKDKNINFITKTILFNDFFKNFQIYPDESNIDISITKKSFKEILRNLFLSHKAKSYFFCGIVLIFSSLILPFNTYYIIFGTILLIFSIICKLIPAISDK